MSRPREHVVRDFLAGQLHLLEPGLRLHSTEFRLHNSVGTRGYIDILARDHNQMWVIIEVKLDKKQSREAVSEIAKYVELLARDRHVATDRIRVIIASADWAELLAPVSLVARELSTDIRGYQFAVNADGTVVHVHSVELLSPPAERFITPIHVIYFFSTAQGREQWWSSIKAVAAGIGAPDLLGAFFDRVDKNNYVAARYGLYLGIGNVDPAMIIEEIAGPYEGPEPFAQEYPAEYQALCRITREIHSGTTMRAVADIESAVPSDLYKIDNDPNWQITGYVGAGVFAETGAHEEEDLRRFLSGDDLGQSQLIFEGSANPRIQSRWESFCEQATGSLSGNPEWSILVPGWLEYAAKYPGDVNVRLKVYNPCDLVQTIVYGWPDRVLEYMPLVEGRVSRPGVGEIFLVGELCWDGRSGKNVPEHIGEVYREPLDWLMAQHDGTTWIFDRMLFKRMGLRYILHEVVVDLPPSESEVLIPQEWTIWTVEEGKARRVTTRNLDEYFAVLAELSRDGVIRSVDDYLAANPGQVEAAIRNLVCDIIMPPSWYEEASDWL
jgi:Endonuclease NucS